MTDLMILSLPWAAIVAALLIERHTETRREAVDRAQERAGWQTMVGDLAQRVQAPEIAVAQHGTNHPSPQAIPLEDDKAYWEAVEKMRDLERQLDGIVS